MLPSGGYFELAGGVLQWCHSHLDLGQKGQAEIGVRPIDRVMSVVKGVKGHVDVKIKDYPRH